MFVYKEKASTQPYTILTIFYGGWGGGREEEREREEEEEEEAKLALYIPAEAPVAPGV